MSIVRSFIIAVAFLFAGVISASVTPNEVPSMQAAWDLDFPDPSVIKAKDGYYYAYATQTITEQGPKRLLNLQVARSKDLNSWTHLGDALPMKPAWASKGQKFWAPHVAEHGGKYFAYYSAEPDQGKGLCLAVAVSISPAGPFTDIGNPLRCGPGFENIDPMLFEDPKSGLPLLYWGSGFGPIYVQQLASDRISFAANSKLTALIHPQPNSPAEKYMRLVEGAWVEYKNGTYFLFFSGDSCCENPHYAVLVAKSQSAFGPFELLEQSTKTTSVILQESPKFTGPGHNSVITDENGASWILYHAIERANSRLQYPIPGDRFVRRVLLKDRLCWPSDSSGWPEVSATGTCN